MSGNIKNITIEELQKFVSSEEVIKDAKSTKEPIFIASSVVEKEEIDPLVDLEVAIRGCKRTGVFRE